MSFLYTCYSFISSLFDFLCCYFILLTLNRKYFVFLLNLLLGVDSFEFLCNTSINEI